VAAAYCRLGNYNRKKQIRWLQLQKVFEAKRILSRLDLNLRTDSICLAGRKSPSKSKTGAVGRNWTERLPIKFGWLACAA
jgi:hypothetical protein